MNWLVYSLVLFVGSKHWQCSTDLSIPAWIFDIESHCDCIIPRKQLATASVEINIKENLLFCHLELPLNDNQILEYLSIQPFNN